MAMMHPNSNPALDCPLHVAVARFRPKPWWARLISQPHQWVSFYPYIYHPAKVFPLSWPGLVAHNKHHLEQQRKIGRWIYLLKYMASKKFRAEMEYEAVAVELHKTPVAERVMLLDLYARALASAYYMNAVKTPSEARAGILREAKHIGDIDGLPTH